VFASRRHARALVAGLPRQDHVYITTNEMSRFYNDEFDEMPCKLDFTENSRSFEKYPTPREVGYSPAKKERKTSHYALRMSKGDLHLVITRQGNFLDFQFPPPGHERFYSKNISVKGRDKGGPLSVQK